MFNVPYSVRCTVFGAVHSARCVAVYNVRCGMQGWQEVTDVGVSHLLRTVLRKSVKDGVATPGPITSLPDTEKLKKHVSLLCDRLGKGGRLLTSVSGKEALWFVHWVWAFNWFLTAKCCFNSNQVNSKAQQCLHFESCFHCNVLKWEIDSFPPQCFTQVLVCIYIYIHNK